MKLWQVDFAVKDLCPHIEQIVDIVHWEDMTEKDILRELIVCILGSRVRYETSVAYANAISDRIAELPRNVHCDEFLDFVRLILESPAYYEPDDKFYVKYRYPNRGAKQVAESLNIISETYGSVTSLLKIGLPTKDLRRVVVQLCPGIGPKQASHFLKNIGYTEDVAVIDRHILKYMEAAEKISIPDKKLANLDGYEAIEVKFQSIVSKFYHSSSVVDQALWFVIRGLGNEVIT